MTKKSKSKKVSARKKSSEDPESSSGDLEDDYSKDEFGNEEIDDSQEVVDIGFNDDELEEEPGIIQRTKIRSRGLFNNPWWKKGALKGAIVWLIFVVFFYLMDFFGLVQVIDARRWGFFLVLLIILGMAWEKILYKFIKF